MDSLNDRVHMVLEKVRPILQMDGGDVELIEVKDNNVYVRLQGACSGCQGAIFTLKMGIERALKNEIPEIDNVVAVS